ncbi:FlgD immunoglobulin-like domain containing protein [Candidatus Latescibacterota bacterium]
MKALKLIIILCTLCIIAAQANAQPYETTPVIDNEGYVWGYIPPIDNVDQQMNHVKFNPILSKDGEWMVFLGRFNRKLWLVPSQGGTPVVIFDIREEPLPEGSLSQTILDYDIMFTPDGSEISFTRIYDNEALGSYDANPDTMFSSPRNQLYSIMAFNPSTNEYREVVENANSYDWSADGRYVSFIRVDPRAYYDPENAEHHHSPAIYDTQTGETRYLTDENWNQNMLNQTGIITPYSGTTFSPDGSHIVTSKYIDGYRQLVKIPTDGGESEQITYIDHDVLLPNWGPLVPSYSPNGEWILFSIMRSSFIMNNQTGNIYDLFTRKPFDPGTLLVPVETSIFQISGTSTYTWSFDGNKISYNLYATWDTLQDNLATGSTLGVFNHYPVIYDFEPESFEKSTAVDNLQPKEFSITGNYPNPFNPTTTIDFTIPDSGYACLNVFNVSGQKVRELVAGNLYAGKHSVTWDGRDQNGMSVSSGVYITRLMMRDKVTTGQMILIK